MAAYTSEDLAAVRAAIARGERTVVFADRSVTYRSIDELLAIEQRILRELGTPRRRQFTAVSDKGL